MLAQPVVDLVRIEIQKRSASVIDMLTEIATNELEDMEGELAGRCNSFTQQQGMRVCVGLDMIWLDFMSRRPLPLEDGETTISKLCLIAERLSNSLLNHSVEAFRQIGVTGGKTLYLAVDLKCEGDLPEGASCAAILAMTVRAVSNLDVLGRAASRQHGRPGSIAAVIANYPFILGVLEGFPAFSCRPWKPCRRISSFPPKGAAKEISLRRHGSPFL